MRQLQEDGCTIVLPGGARDYGNGWFAPLGRWYNHTLIAWGIRTEVPSQSLELLGQVNRHRQAAAVDQGNPPPPPTTQVQFQPGAVESTQLPVFDPVGFLLGSSQDPLMINTHTLIQGITGGGKTHLTLYLIQKWAFMRRWGHRLGARGRKRPSSTTRSTRGLWIRSRRCSSMNTRRNQGFSVPGLAKKVTKSDALVLLPPDEAEGASAAPVKVKLPTQVDTADCKRKSRLLFLHSTQNKHPDWLCFSHYL
eukprot:m.405494 g.405494  ORF g.405494 m.405494 type:complete len:251 (+) comp16795_c1_seq5:389-1141(+)